MYRRSAFSVSVGLIVMCLGANAVLGGEPPTASPEVMKHVVMLPAQGAVRVTGLGLRPRLNLDYGAFSWMELTDADFALLAGSSVDFKEVPDAYVLTLGETRFDPLRAVPKPAAGWDTVRDDVPDMHLVQFAGPIRSEWLDLLKSGGLEVIQYIHPFTYVVWGESSARAALAAAEGVRWVGGFAPAFRVLPGYRNPGRSMNRVRILIYRGTDTDAVVQAIEQLGGKFDGKRVIDPVLEQAIFLLPAGSLQAAAQVPGVYSIKPVPTDGGLRGEMSDQVNVDNVDGTNLAFPGYQAWLAAAGVDGTGVVIANVDGGVQDTHPDLVGRIIACTGTTCGGGATSSHGTHTAGIMAADGSSGTLDGFGFLRGLGVAPGANLVEQVYSPFFQNPGGMLLLMTDSYNNGASLSGNSWGPSGSPQGYDDDTRQVDVGVRDADPNAPGNQPLTFVLSFMNGNGGTSTQGTPDEAKNLFNIGSTKMQTSGGTQILQIDDISSNSAHGPALDGRTIPHMVAPGCYVDSTVSTNTWGTMCGTSMASPHVSGAVALFIQYYRNLPGGPPDPSPALIKAAFLPVSRDLAGHLDADGGVLGHPFDSKQGWGRMELQKVVDPQVSVRYFDAPQIFDNTGEIWTTTVSAADPAQPLKVMLVWTDAPGHGLGGSTPAWNNNLDLEVQSGANLYRGNNFAASGWSQTGGVADGMNNTEGVFIGPTASGAFTIRVIASNITSDGVPNQGDGTDQDFALACYNCAIDPDFTINATPGAQSLCAPADAVYTVDVGQLVGFTDPVTLSTAGAPAGSTASFSTNPVTPPGSSVLTISNTGAVAAGSYAFDIVGASTTGTHSFPVTLDIFDTVPTPPAALTPTDGATDVPLVPTFTWTGVAQASTYDIEIATDAAFTAVVDSATVSDVTYTPGTALATITTYYWHVRASNPCGTGSYGATVSFTTLDTPPILLVDDDDNSPDVRSFYTGALDALGLTYDTWDTNNTDNEPSATQLAPYSLVIWFTGDEFGGAAGPGAAGEAALATWLDQGNCLFISSQDYYYDRGITAFMTGYLGIASASSDVGQTSVTGAGTVFGGMGPYTLSYPFTNYSDNVNVGAGAEVSFVGNQGNTAVNKDSGVYQTTFWTFPFEAVPNLSDRTALLSAVLNLCNPAPPVPACPTVRGDMTGADGVNGDDIRLFVICYLTGDPWKPGCGCSDMNMSGAYESEDMTLFVDCLLTEACP